jgi:hypothetical protein
MITPTLELAADLIEAKESLRLARYRLDDAKRRYAASLPDSIQLMTVDELRALAATLPTMIMDRCRVHPMPH